MKTKCQDAVDYSKWKFHFNNQAFLKLLNVLLFSFLSLQKLHLLWESALAITEECWGRALYALVQSSKFRVNGMLHQVRTIMNMLRLNESRARQWLIRNFNSLCKLSACYTLLPLYDVLEEYCLRISYIK